MKSVLLISFLVLLGPGNAKAETDKSSSLPVCPAADIISEGDSLALYVFEKTSSRDGEWTRNVDAASRLGDFALRTEWSGELKVGDDGSLFLPLMGAMKASGANTVELSKYISEKARDLSGRESISQINISKRKPVFIVGSVAKPGRYDYFQGMAVIHVIALSGGVERNLFLAQRSDEPAPKLTIGRDSGAKIIEHTVVTLHTTLCPGDVVRVME